MKILNLFFLAICFVFSSTQLLASSTSKIALKEAKKVIINPTSTIPKEVMFSDTQIVLENTFTSWIVTQFSLKSGTGFILLNTTSDELGYKHTRYQQTYNNILIEGTMILVHSKEGRVVSFNGNAASNISIATQATVLENVALKTALKSHPAKKYFWKDQNSKRISEDPYTPEGELKIIPLNRDLNNLRLAYKFEILSLEPLKGSFIYIDALTGNKLQEKEAMFHIDEDGTAVTKYSGTRTIKTTKNNAGNYVLREEERGGGIETRDLRVQVGQQQANGNFNSYEFEDADNYWNNVNNQMDEAATDAHWGAEMTYDYFFLEHGRNSIDGNGIKLTSYVHLNTNGQANAFWLPSKNSMFYGEGQGIALTFIDVAGHEITHGLTSHSANLEYQGESGALNESFSDIFGKSIENYSRPNNTSWEVGIDGGNALRSMQNPKSKGDPDTYKGSNWVNTSSQDDNGGVHSNSGVQNYWYYLLVEGGAGSNDNNEAFQVNGIGWEKASKVAFRNLTVYLSQYSDYNDARAYAIQSAEDLFGGCSAEVIAVTNAWHAVGVGSKYQVGNAVSSFTSITTEGCTVPFDITFENTSSNGGNSYWDFGDGVTSTEVHPTHTYNTPGVYSVELKVSGDCGADSVLKTDFITIDENIPCVLNMISGIKVFNACSGTLYDNGGPNGVYSNNEDFVFTIAPSNAANVTIEFVSFDVEAGDQGQGICNYDYVSLHDGNDVNSQELYKFCGTNLPQLNSQYTSTGGSLTIRLNSDQYENGDGFEINWSCEKLITDVENTISFDLDLFVLDRVLVMSYPKDFNGANYRILDISGKVIFKGQIKKEIDLSSISSGIYIVQLSSGNKAINKKIRIK